MLWGLNSRFMCQFMLENQSKVREKSVKSQEICLELTSGKLVCAYFYVNKIVCTKAFLKLQNTVI